MEVWWGGDIFLETGEEVWDEEQLEGGLGRGLRLNCKKKKDLIIVVVVIIIIMCCIIPCGGKAFV